MRNSKYIPALVFLAVNAVYVYILGTVNSELSAYASLLLPSVFIVGPALFLGTWRTVAVVGFSAFLWAATTPVRAGLVAALWLAAALCVHTIRFRFRPLDTASICALYLAVNFALVMAYMLFFLNGCGSISGYLLRVFTDSFVSAVALVFVAKPALMIPLSLLKIGGIEMRIEEDAR